MEALLVAENLGKLYGLRPVLRGVSLTVARGEFVAVLGANGAGKTTLLKILATLVRPNTGALRVDGIDALTHASRARARIGVVSHQSLIYPDLTAYENIRFYADMYGARVSSSTAQTAPGSPGADQSPIERTLRSVELWQRKDDLARTFSRGMIQRLSIARAIVHDPPLLLFDEPFTGLDQSSAANLSALLRQTALNGRAVIMTSHELSRGLDGVTRALILKGGRIEYELDTGLTPEHLTELLAAPSTLRQPSFATGGDTSPATDGSDSGGGRSA